MNTLIDLTKVAGMALHFQVAKGEILYVKQNSNSRLLVDTLLCRTDSLSNEGKVLDMDLNAMTADSIQKLRKQIGFVDPDMYLDTEKSIAKNFKTYAEVLGMNYSSSLIVLDTYLSKLGLNGGDKVKSLDWKARYVARFAICLAKKPKVIITQNLPLLSDLEDSEKTLKSIYHLALTEGIGFIAFITDKSLLEHLPGRYIEL